MKLARREFLSLSAAASTLPALSQAAWAQTYPSRPLHIVVGVPAGLAPDITARLVGQSLSERIGRPIIVENRPGAGGNIGTELVVRAAPDGYTLLLAIASDAFNAALYPKASFSFVRDITPIALIGTTPFVLVVNPSVPAKTVPEFVAYAKAHPGKLNMASPGIGTAPHLFGELFEMMTGVDMIHVPYRGNQFADLLAGRVHVLFTGIPPALDYIRTGKLRALGVTSTSRVNVLTDVPAIDEFVPGYQATGWNGIGAPKGTPADIIERLNKETNAVIADAAAKARLIAIGVQPTPMTPTQFSKLILHETEKWAKVVKFANIAPA